MEGKTRIIFQSKHAAEFRDGIVTPQPIEDLVMIKVSDETLGRSVHEINNYDILTRRRRTRRLDYHSLLVS